MTEPSCPPPGGLLSTRSSERCSCVAVGTVKPTASRWYQGLAMVLCMAKQTNIRLDDAVKAAAEDRAKRRGLTLQGYVADLIEADVNQARAAFMAGAATFLAEYSDEFEAEVGEDRYPGLPEGLAESAPRDAA